MLIARRLFASTQGIVQPKADSRGVQLFLVAQRAGAFGLLQALLEVRLYFDAQLIGEGVAHTYCQVNITRVGIQIPGQGFCF